MTGSVFGLTIDDGDGRLVGLELGLCVGIRVGPLVGCLDGCRDGCFDGRREGCLVGCRETGRGCCVGFDVGCFPITSSHEDKSIIPS